MAPLPEVTGYRDLVEIGRGGFARVYRAHQERFNRAVALKVLDLADPDERTRDRFERECQAMGELSWHPHVVAVYDSGVTESGHLWLAMEYLERGSLADAALANGSVLDWAGTTTAGIEVCGALGAAHAAGTLHRDLKPENVLVGPFGEARLSDFGIAAVDGGRRTTTGVASFTVAHVAPEVLRGHRQDERTDVYGLSSTLHTLLAGQPPFEGEPNEPVATVMMRVIDTPPPRLADPVPSDLADLLVAGLAKDPDDRPQSAAELGAALQDIQRAHGLAPTPLRLAAGRPSGSGVAAAPDASETVTVGDEPDEPDETHEPDGPDGSDGPVTAPEPSPEPDAAATITVGTLPPPAAPAGEPDPVVATPPVVPPPSAPEPDANATVTVATGAMVPPVAPPETAETAEPGAAPVEPAAPNDGPGSPPSPTPPPPPQGSPPGRGKAPALLIAAAVVVVLALVVGAVVLLGGGDDGGDTEGTFQTAAFATSPVAVAVDADAVWVTDSAETLVYKLDPETGEEITNTGINNVGTGIALTQPDAAGWITGDDTAELIRIDLATAADTNQVEVGDRQQAISAAGSDVWVTRDRDGIGSLVRLDAIELGLVTEIEVGTAPNAVSATDDAVWVTNGGDNTVSRVDPDTNDVTATVDVGVAPFSVAAVEDAVWVVSKDARTVTRIDPDTNEVVATVELDGDAVPGAVAATADAVWVTDGGSNEVLRIDPATNEVTDTIAVGDEPVAVAATDTDVWVANAGAGTLTHLDPTAFG